MIIREALFSDETKTCITPFEADANTEVTITFRAAKEDLSYVFLCSHEFPDGILMHLIYSEADFRYYKSTIRLEEKPFVYWFKIIEGSDMCYYNKLGAVNELNESFAFRIIPGYKTPDWAKGAVMYQIFVDRFYNGDSSNDVLDGEYSYIGKDSVQVKNWNKYPDSDGIREFYGGDLAGVIQKLPYLHKLGVEVIYFNPLFVSPSNHKYDIEDYDNIDPHFGVILDDGGEKVNNGDNRTAERYIKRVTGLANLEASNELFAKVVTEAHKLGIKVIIDGVFNHCGSFNKWMDKECIYDGKEGFEHGAYVAKDSPYRSFFKFNSDKWPFNNDYDGWWNYDTLPKLNYEESDKLFEYIMNIGRKWVSPPYNADGWRLDVAADLGNTEEFNHKFWREFRRNVKEANPEALILAEHYGNPSAWLRGEEWDSVMNYDAFMEPISWFLTGMEKHSDEFRNDYLGNADYFFEIMRYNMATFPKPSLLVAMNELSNHDHSRFYSRTNHVVGRTADLGPKLANINVDKAVMKMAVIMQMTWPGAPTIYYGDEAGVCGFTDPDNRRSYPWGNEDLELLEFHRDAIAMHKDNLALKIGSYDPIYKEKDVIAYARFYKRESVVVTVINISEEEKHVEIPVWVAGIGRKEQIERIMLTSENSYNVGKLLMPNSNGILEVDLPAKSASVYRRKCD